MGDGLLSKDVWISELESESDRYPAFSKTGDYVYQNYEGLTKDRLSYEAKNRGSALPDYEKPENFVEALDSVKDDDFVNSVW